MDSRIRGLDGLRAIAVGLVVLNHNFYSNFHLLTGGSAVRLFFVLSGFLIISILHRRRLAIETQGAVSGHELKIFYQNRAYRIWPAYYAALALGAAGVWVRPMAELDVPSWIANVLFLGNAMIAHAWFDWRQVGVFWSVAVEEQFYLIAGLALLLIPARRHLLICALVVCVATLTAVITPQLTPDASAAKLSVDIGSLTNFGYIALGGAAALALPQSRLLSALAWPALGVYLAGTFFGFPQWMSGPFFFAPALLICVVLVGIAGGQDGLLVHLLDAPPLRSIGQISYGIYLYHTLIPLDLVPGLSGLENHATLQALAKTVLSVGLAALSWQFLEKPLLRLRDRRRTEAAQTSAGRQTLAGVKF